MNAIRRAPSGASPMSTNDDARAQLATFKRVMRGKNLVITQGYLRDDFALSGTTPAPIKWTMTQNTNVTATVNAQRLQPNDAFLVMAIGFYIGLSATTAGAESAAQQNAMKLHVFPNSIVMPGTGDAEALQQLYNGYISIKEASTTYFEALDVYGFYRVGVSQQGVQVSQQDAGVGTNGAYLRGQWDDSDYGFIPLKTPFRMAGDHTYQIILTTGQAAAFAALSGTNGKLYATLRFKGFLATGGAKFIDS